MPWLIRPTKIPIAHKFSLPLATRQAHEGVPHRHNDSLLELAKYDTGKLFEALDCGSEGFSESEAESRLVRFGPNEVSHEKGSHWLIQLWSAFKTPFSLLLSILSVISFLTQDTAGGISIAVMVLLSTFLAFFQEFRSSRAAERLTAMVSTSATVIRKGVPKKEIPMRQVVPGDIVLLSVGDMVPADIRLLTEKDLFVSQAALTGEALPVEKSLACAPDCKSALEAGNLCFMGSNVLSGTASALVLKTGGETYFGSLAATITHERVLTSFEKGVNRFTLLMLRFMLVMAPLVFVINGLSKHDWFEAFLFAVAVAVGLTPEMLPMIVTVNLARGAMAMSKKKVIVKRLNAIQNFGAMDVLCTDKTGTLTQNKVALLKYVDVHGDSSPKVLKYGYLNSFFQTGLRNLLDVAVLESAEMKQELKTELKYRKIDEIPFDFERRRMSVVVEEEGQRDLHICKGALEEVFSVCDRADNSGQIIAMGEGLRKSLRQIATALNEDGLRVIAVAYKECPTEHAPYSVKDESGMILLGYLAFLDPPKESAAGAIKLLEGRGVKVKVLTGDNDLVSRKVCGQVGIQTDRILLGPEIDAMSEAQLAAAAEEYSVFARLSPHHKERIVGALHAGGHVVGFMGDGINDAPALKAADVGISVDNAVDIAKESADIILLENSLLVLADGVQEGRRVFGNIVKYIKMGASSNFGNTFSVLGSSLLLPFLPMLPVQMLMQNLLYDFSQTAIPFDRVDEEYLARPRRWEIGEIGRFMLFIGPISSLFDYATFALMWFVYQANTPAQQGLFQSGWFVEGLLSQTIIVHLIRTNKIPFIESRATWPLAVTTALILGLGIWIPFSPLADAAKLQPLPLSYFGWLSLTLFAYMALTQVMKAWFIRKYSLS